MTQYLQDNWFSALFLGVSAIVSLLLIIRVWLFHRHDSFPKKLRWSILLLVPFFGWVFYGAFYTPLSENDVKAAPGPYGAI